MIRNSKLRITIFVSSSSYLRQPLSSWEVDHRPKIAGKGIDNCVPTAFCKQISSLGKEIELLVPVRGNPRIPVTQSVYFFFFFFFNVNSLLR